MKAVICGAVLTMAISLPTVAQEELKGCDAKAFALEQQIEYATVQGNQKRIDGLKRALAAIEDECSEEEFTRKTASRSRTKSAKSKSSRARIGRGTNVGFERQNREKAPKVR